jgi:hypothetical protein
MFIEKILICDNIQKCPGDISGCSVAWLARLLWEQEVGGSNPLTPTIIPVHIFRAGIAQLARASAFQVEGRGFESRFPLHHIIPEKNNLQ